jgi:diacylglycerol O-acyltransferase / wax synthase
MPRRQELSALDELFLRLEGPEVHMHVGSLAIFRGPAPGRAELLDVFDRRLDLVPRLRQVVTEVPLGLGRPVWLDDTSFDLDHHISTETAHGDLNSLVAGLMSRPLDRSRPLWDVWLVDGLPEDRFALVSRTHHSLVDGVAGADVIAVMLDPSPTAPVRPRSSWTPEPAPTPEDLGREALHRLLHSPGEAAARILGALAEDPAGVTQKVAARLGAVADFVAESFSAPPSTLNQPIGSRRRFETVLADLEELLAVKRAFGVKLNDVVLSVVAGGLRHLLDSRGEAVTGSLRAGVPISLRAPGEALTLGNRIASVWAALPVQEPDPATRLALVHDEMTRLKSSDQVAGVEALLSFGQWLPPALVAQAARLLARQRAFNLVITNVPGPRAPLYCLGRRLTELYPLVPLGANATVAVALFSYDTTIGFGIMGDYDAAPDLALLAEGIEKEIAALVRA